MNKNLCFKLADLLGVTCILILFSAAILPAVFYSAGRSREAVCRNNLKLIGVGLELWRQNANKYPMWDMVGLISESPDLAPWPDALTMTSPYTADNLEAHRRDLTAAGFLPEYFIKTVDDSKIFRCPGDQPSPHRINKERAFAWSMGPYEYSYAITNAASFGANDQKSDKQILALDGTWDWSQNLSCYWINNPNAHFDTGGWYCNTVGFWHKKNSTNLIMRDLHVENHIYPPDTTKVFVWESGESLNVFH
jgi:hypothetical protein